MGPATRSKDASAATRRLSAPLHPMARRRDNIASPCSPSRRQPRATERDVIRRGSEHPAMLPLMLPGMKRPPKLELAKAA
jgi:hypothetical protein